MRTLRAFHLGLSMTANTRKPADILAEVSLIDAAACAEVGSMATSWWHEKVRTGIAPQPVVRKPRCTRWRVSDVRDFWQGFAEAADDNAAAQVIAKATKASAAASAKRAAIALTKSASRAA